MQREIFSLKTIASVLAVLAIAFSAPIVFAGHATGNMPDDERGQDDNETGNANETTRTYAEDRDPRTTQGQADESGQMTFRNAAGDVITISRDSLSEDPFASATEEDNENEDAVTGASVQDSIDWTVGQTLLCRVSNAEEDAHIELRCEPEDYATTGAGVDDQEQPMTTITRDNQKTSETKASANDTTNDTSDQEDSSIDQEMTVRNERQNSQESYTESDNARTGGRFSWNPFNWFRND